MGKFLSATLIVCIFCGVFKWGHSEDYFFTQSTYFDKRKWFSLFIDYNQYLKQNKFSVNQYLLQEISFEIKTTLVKNVEAGIAVPLVFGHNYLNDNELPSTLGNIEFELKFGKDDDEYDYRYAYYFKYRVSTGPPTQKPLLSIEDEQNINHSYYPLTSSLEEMTLGWHASKNIGRYVKVHLNFNYTYQFTNNQGITNLFRFENVSSDNVETNARGGKLSPTRLTLFGLDSFLRQLFWTTSLNNPWSDKQNDYLNIAMAVDFYLNTDYYLGTKKILLGVKPFLEINWLLPFSGESFYTSKFIFIPGLLLNFTKNFNYLFGLGVGVQEHFNFEQTAFMSFRIIL